MGGASNDNEEPQPHESLSAADLEARLKATPTLDTDIMEFMAIVGLSYHWESLHETGNETHFNEAKNRYEKRRSTLSRSERIQHSILANCLYGNYLGGRIRNLNDLKETIETKGPRFSPNFGLKSVAYLNSVLAEYHIVPFTVGGYGNTPKRLSTHGLKPSER